MIVDGWNAWVSASAVAGQISAISPRRARSASQMVISTPTVISV